MLTHLIIRNFAIIEHLEIPFRAGFTVVTGETGAGKSIIIDALNLLLGGRASTEVIRTDEHEAIVEGVFEPQGTVAERIAVLLEERGVEFEGQLIVRRILSRSGRNKVFINGSLTTLSSLAEVTRGLVDISGQHEHYSLVRSEEHLVLLDSFADFGEGPEAMQQAFQEVRRLERELKSLEADDRERLHRADFLRFQLQEIDAAKLERGEEEEHEAKVEKLKYAERISDAVRLAASQTYEADGSAVERLDQALEALKRVASFDPKLAEMAKRLEEAQMLIGDLARDLQDYDIVVDTRLLDELIGRLEMIKKLRHKYGSSIDEILDQADEMRSELHRLENAEEHGEELKKELARARQAAWTIARKISERRRKTAKILQEAIEAELADLNMARAQFVIAFKPEELPGPTMPAEAAPQDLPKLSAQGFDEVEFLLAPNPGEEAKPLAKIASGGELSRIMLAIKTVLAGRDSIATYVFDEVDTGIGGATADIVGAKIQATGRTHQVLCITHLASIASRSDHHYLVEKLLVDGRTQSTIRPLDDKERVEAIAQMLGGARVTQKTLEAAQDLLLVSTNSR